MTRVVEERDRWTEHIAVVAIEQVDKRRGR
jgi:hypothetical protein